MCGNPTFDKIAFLVVVIILLFDLVVDNIKETFMVILKFLP